MKKGIAFICLMVSTVFYSTAQTVIPPVYEIHSDTIYWQEIKNTHWKLLEDKSGRLTIEQVVKMYEKGRFHSITSKTDTTVNTYWFRYSIKNVMSREAHVSLNSMCAMDDFYVLQTNGTWKHFSSGYNQQWDKKDGLKKADCIPQVVQPGQEILIFQRTQNKKAGLPHDFQIAILSTQKAMLGTYVSVLDTTPVLFPFEMMMEVFYAGMLLIVFVFSILFYRAVRQKVYLYFALYVFLLSITKFTNPFFIFIDWYDRESAAIGYYFSFLTPFLTYFLIQFIRLFFSIKTNFPRWDTFLWLLSIVLIPLLLARAYFFIHSYTDFPLLRKILIIPGYNFLFVFLPLLISLFMFIGEAKKNSQYKIIIAGALPNLLWRVITSAFDLFYYIIYKWDSNDYSGFFNWAFYNIVEIITMLWFILSFSFVLFQQFIELKKQNVQQELDKERLAKEKEVERNMLIAQQKIQLEKEVEERTSDLKKSLEELKQTQTQLIQKEKLASLGELTAGIAHEIQNPLNFVNNFSELSEELLTEMEEEIAQGNAEEVKAISKDLKQNLAKINHHGKRASSIVKGMLEHSRASTGVKELTDINKLADEYLRLAYHGLRAKDKDFNSDFELITDEKLPRINVIPQDIGRVILNLVNNAFYAVSKRTNNVGEVLNLSDVKPIVKVSTKYIDNQIIIKIKDNGIGMSEEVKAKIFQPFFTTKPTGEGTGLGLSLAYDIVTKGHGGTLEVESVEGEGTTFVITLPFKSIG
ncbi:MAG: ATP-binding protein [Spirosomataceae bacterium]